MRRTIRAGLLPFLALAVTIACSKAAAPLPSPSPYAPPPTMAAPAALKVSDVEVGRAVDADMRISDKTDSFKPADTIYVSVGTEGSSPGASLAAHWTYQDGQVVKHDETSVAPSGPAHTEFHISKPSGWPAGDYKVEVLLNGASAGTKSFKVSK
jgi:hypothetical protein